MTSFVCLWKGIILTFLYSNLYYFNVDARRYDKCTTTDGREGLCVVKRYCREATNHPLLPCENDEENHCCPIPTSESSAQSTRPPTDRLRDTVPEQPKDKVRLPPIEVPKEHVRPDIIGITSSYHDDRDGSHPVEVHKEYDRPESENRPSLQQNGRDRSRPVQSHQEHDRPVSKDRPLPQGNERDRTRQDDRRKQNPPRQHEHGHSVFNDGDRLRPVVMKDRPKSSQDESDIQHPEGPRDDNEPRVISNDKGRRRPELSTVGDPHRYGQDGRDHERDGNIKHDYLGNEKDRQQRPEVSRDGDRSRDGQDRLRTEVTRQRDRTRDREDQLRPEISRERDQSKDGQDRQRPEVLKEQNHSNDQQDRLHSEVSRKRDQSRNGPDRLRPEVSRERGQSGDGQGRQRPNNHREPDRVRLEHNPGNGADERDRRRPIVFKEPLRDDRLNKTPPPGDRRSPTRHQIGRPPEYEDDDIGEGNRRPSKPVERPQSVPADRVRDEDRSFRPPPVRTNDQDRRKPPPVRFYPSTDELDIHTVTPNNRPNPSRKRNTTEDSSKTPIRFPGTYELSVPRPKVPACGVKPYELFIAGGMESEENEWPWMTAIFRRHSDSRPKTFLCGGSLINTKYVLTAAHCFVNNYVVLPASSFVVRLGSHRLDSGEEYTVSNLIIHQNHSGSDFFNDIALMRLASEVYVTDKIAPICMPYPEMMHQSLVGRMATVAGWGDVSFRSNGDRILQHVTVPIVSGEECFSAYSRVRGAAFLARGSDHVICAGLREGGKDACLGDSGGPLMLKMTDDRWIVVGIVSLGYKCAEPGYPGVYTRVSHYMSWINTNMKKH